MRISPPDLSIGEAQSKAKRCQGVGNLLRSSREPVQNDLNFGAAGRPRDLLGRAESWQ